MSGQRKPEERDSLVHNDWHGTPGVMTGFEEGLLALCSKLLFVVECCWKYPECPPLGLGDRQELIASPEDRQNHSLKHQELAGTE